MKKSFNVALNEPTAFITVGRQRQKQHGKNIYLHDKTEFEIELHNPTNDSVKATIEFNGKQISTTGIVLKPGQRVFLERYLDVDRKFLFETYEVDNTQENKNAIEENGLVTVRFFKKYYNYYTSNYYANNFSNINNQFTGTYFSDTTLTSSVSQSPQKKSLETGRVEMGNTSNQKFGTSYETFEVFYTWVSEWKIMPYSAKNITSEDLIRKCSECGTKVKDNFKFCPHCGEKINKRTKTEIIYTEGVTFDYNGRFYVLQTFNMPLDEFLEKNKNKLIVLNTKYLLPDTLRAVVITD